MDDDYVSTDFESLFINVNDSEQTKIEHLGDKDGLGKAQEN